MAYKEDLRHALSLMETALQVLDKAEQALDVAAHLDLAIHRLKEMLSQDDAGEALG
jgi:hypothetical protein